MKLKMADSLIQAKEAKGYYKEILNYFNNKVTSFRVY